MPGQSEKAPSEPTLAVSAAEIAPQDREVPEPLLPGTALPEIAPDRIAADPLRDGLDYWLSKQASDGLSGDVSGDLPSCTPSRLLAHLPGRADLDPTEIPRLLPYVELTEVLDGGADFRFRLVGSHLVDTDQINPTGQRFSEFFKNPAYRSYQFGLYGWVVAQARPLYSSSRIPLPTRGLDVLTTRLYLPLSGDGRDVDMILNFQICEGVADSGLELEAALDPSNGESFVATLRLPA